MNTLTILPSQNDAESLSKTLKVLPRNEIEPIVALNGTTDASREIAESYGVTVFDFEAKGKLPAIQATLKKLGKRALEPIIILDSDTQPVFPVSWHDTIHAALTQNDDPMYVSAPVWFTKRPEGSHTEALLLSLYRHIDGVKRNKKDVKKGYGAYYGPNQAMKLKDDEVLEAVLALPHYWPKEDVAMARAITENGGTMRQLFSPMAAARTEVSYTFPPFKDWFGNDLKDIDKYIIEQYRQNATEESIEFIDKEWGRKSE